MFCVLSNSIRCAEVMLGRITPLLLPNPGAMCIMAEGCGVVVPTPTCAESPNGNKKIEARVRRLTIANALSPDFMAFWGLMQTLLIVRVIS